jgi:hypothetical protein
MTGQRGTWDYTSDELLSECCRRTATVNANPYAAIEAHRTAVHQEMASMVQWLALTTVILSTARTIKADQARLDYLTSIPESAWPPTPAPFCEHRDATLDAIRRSIGWKQQS